jgi:hypothetical protein
MLLSAEIIVHTNHKNLTYTLSVNQCVIRQLNYVERFGPKYVHISENDNFLADMFSQLDCLSKQTVDPLKKESTDSNFSFILSDEELLECFLNLPDDNHIPFALDLVRIAQGQQQDNELWQQHIDHPRSTQ